MQKAYILSIKPRFEQKIKYLLLKKLSGEAFDLGSSPGFQQISNFGPLVAKQFLKFSFYNMKTGKDGWKLASGLNKHSDNEGISQNFSNKKFNFHKNNSNLCHKKCKGYQQKS